MAKKIVIINGSPRPKGNTALLCQAFMEGAREAGHEARIFDLQKMKIGGCIGCMRGGKDLASPCTIKDDMDQIYPAYEEADVVALATPMYYWAFSGQLKTAFDRLFAVAEHNPDYANPVKECVLIMPAEGDAESNWKPAVDYYRSLCSFLNWKNRGEILAGGVLEDGAVAGKPAIGEARRLGASL